MNACIASCGGVARLCAQRVNLVVAGAGELQGGFQFDLECMQQHDVRLGQPGVGSVDGRGGVVGEVDRCEDAPVGRIRALLHREQRPPRGAQHAFGGRSEQAFAHEMLAARAHHQQVGVSFLGEFDQGRQRRTLLQNRVDRAAMAGRQVLRQVAQAALRLFEQLRFQSICVLAEQAVQMIQCRTADRMRKSEPGVGVRRGELRGALQRMARRGGKISGGEQCFGLGHGLSSVRQRRAFFKHPV